MSKIQSDSEIINNQQQIASKLNEYHINIVHEITEDTVTPYIY